LTDLLERASDEADNDEQDFAPTEPEPGKKQHDRPITTCPPDPHEIGEVRLPVAPRLNELN
jgi:hypothetical protein